MYMKTDVSKTDVYEFWGQNKQPQKPPKTVPKTRVENSFGRISSESVRPNEFWGQNKQPPKASQNCPQVRVEQFDRMSSEGPKFTLDTNRWNPF